MYAAPAAVAVCGGEKDDETIGHPARHRGPTPGRWVRTLKILVVSDLHYSLPQLDWLVRMAPRYDLVIVAGDLVDTASSVTLSAQMLVIRKYLDRLRQATRVILCSGNHDLDSEDDSGERWARWVQDAQADGHAVDGESVALDDMLFTVCPWWDGDATRAAIGEQLAQIAKGSRPEAWHWVYHAPPGNVPVSWSGQRHFGDPALSDWIAEFAPDLVFCGHVHEAPFARGGSWVSVIGATLCFNAGRQYGDFPTHIVLDTERKLAAWFSVEGAEELDWSNPAAARPVPLETLPDWMPR